ncbi:MAG: hypothetical protein IJ386_01060 [Clostridia bacterium]|nr:hypothetical protein [Clostridia bacterium]
MKKLFRFILTLVVIAVAVTFLPKLLHNCDDCGDFFFGTGYRAAAVTDMIAGEDMVLCKNCAEAHHAIALGLGKSLDDYAIPLFEGDS